MLLYIYAQFYFKVACNKIFQSFDATDAYILDILNMCFALCKAFEIKEGHMYVFCQFNFISWVLNCRDAISLLE